MAERVLSDIEVADIRKKVYGIVTEHFKGIKTKGPDGVEKEVEITDETNFVEDLSADSLDGVEVVMELEEKFGLTIPDEDAEKIQTVGKAIDYAKTALIKKTVDEENIPQVPA